MSEETDLESTELENKGQIIKAVNEVTYQHTKATEEEFLNFMQRVNEVGMSKKKKERR